MPSIWTLQTDLFFNINRPKGGTLLRDIFGQANAPTQSWVAADCFLARIFFLKPSVNFGTAADIAVLEAGDTMVLSGKNAAGTLLFSAIDWAPVTEGADDAAVTRYEGVVDLNTVPLLALFSGNTTQVTITGELEVRNAGNTRRLSCQFDLQILRQSYAGESAPNPATPLYPAPNELALITPANGTYRIKTNETGSYLQIKNATNGKFHTLFVTGDTGAETLAIGDGEA
ncbi:MAG TPA: hypothetical protein VL357_06070 [Rariglobus sp.]|jgi:hypothetical protein|nr:hypothetical protein [Rariglobus sp.]